MKTRVSVIRALSAACVMQLALVASAERLNAQDARLAQRLDPGTAAAIAAAVDSAAAAGLPTEPLIQRALQGAAKRVDRRRIVSAVRSLGVELRDARSALGARSTEAEIIAGAASLHAGVAAADVTRVRSSRGTESATVALATLSDLISRGVPVNAALDAILSLSQRRVDDGAFVALSRDVARDIAEGVPPAAATRIRSQRIRATPIQRVPVTRPPPTAERPPAPPTRRPGSDGTGRTP